MGPKRLTNLVNYINSYFYLWGELDAGVKFKPSKLRRVSDYQTRFGTEHQTKFGTEHQTSNSPMDYNSLYQHKLMKDYDGMDHQKTSAADIEQV